MNRKPIVLFFLIGIALMMFSSCASSSLLTTWKDESYNSTLKRVLIIGVFKRDYMRPKFEEEFVRQFKAKGVDAVSAYRVLPSTKELEKNEIRLKVNELNIDAVLVTRLVDERTVETYIHPTQMIVARPRYARPYYGGYANYNNLHGFYGGSVQVINTPGYTLVEKFVVLETNLYDAKTEEIIWNVTSETLLGETSSKLVKSLVKQLVANLNEMKML
jgi:hypothetical protein